MGLNISSSAASASGWQTALDLDFSAQGSQAMGTNGSYTIGGYSWSRQNAASDRVAMALTNGTGLVIQPGTSDYFDATRTVPLVRLPLSQLAIPNLSWSTRLRIWAYISADNSAANFDFCGAGLDNDATTRDFLTVRMFNTTGNIGVRKNVDSVRTDALTSGLTLGATNRVIVCELEGVLPTQMRAYYGSFGATDFPTLTTLQATAGQSLAPLVSSGATVPDAMGVVLFAGRATPSATLLSVTFKKVRVDYKL